MVALEVTSSGPIDYRAGDDDFDFPHARTLNKPNRTGRGRLRDASAFDAFNEPTPRVPAHVIEIVDDVGAPLAYVPTDMADGQARAHAAMIAAAPQLLDLVRFAAAHIDERSHPGAIRAFRARCADVVDKVEDQILMS